jgi:predicted dinucleotide-binding enzyme
MQTGIIGSGRALGAWLVKTGFPVLFMSRNQTQAMEGAHMAGYDAKSPTTTAPIRKSDIILLTLPFGEIRVCPFAGCAVPEKDS